LTEALRRPEVGQGSASWGNYIDHVSKLWRVYSTKIIQTNLESQKLGIDFRIEFLKVGVGRDDTPFQREDGFDDTSQATGSFQVAYVGFHSTTMAMISCAGDSCTGADGAYT